MTDGVGSARGVGAALGGGHATVEVSLSETTGHTSPLTWGWSMASAETWGSAPTTAYVVTWGPSALETIGSADALASAFTYYPIQTDTHTLTGSVTPGWPKTATDAIQVSSSLSAAYALAVLEGLGMLGPASVAAIYRPVFAETIEYSDVLRRFFGGELAETVRVTPELTRLPRLVRTAAETYAFSETATPSLVLRITLSDTTSIADVDTPQAVFGLLLEEGIKLSAAYIGPNGNITTWVVNSLTGGTTEYQNYNFNSFAQLGHKYLAASAGGLYKLNGDNDDGAAIIAKVRSGYAQFNSSRFSGFKAAYLGLRGTGNMVFRLISADGKTYNYAVKARDMKTVKVMLGKGLRARYFAFELESTGQDFDLETVELVPMVSTRRV